MLDEASWHIAGKHAPQQQWKKRIEKQQSESAQFSNLILHTMMQVLYTINVLNFWHLLQMLTIMEIFSCTMINQNAAVVSVTIKLT